ncbi:MAG TPA: hypothetical protein VMR62_02735, partial [Bryobacteraceae bacterium]|nr:hypothetical protein [Bryobacteraceae bacterium]
MMNQNDKNFIWLNRGDRWLGHHWDGLEIGADGALRLATLPLAVALDAQPLAALPAPTGPSGIALDTLGSVYFSDPGQNRVVSISGCDGTEQHLPCMGEGCGIAQLRQPRGLAWSPSRQALLIVDSGNDRVVVFNPDFSSNLPAERGQAADNKRNRPPTMAGGRKTVCKCDEGAYPAVIRC